MVIPFATDVSADAERWMRQLWQGWTDAMRNAATAPAAGQGFPGWSPSIPPWASVPAFGHGSAASGMPNWQHWIDGWMRQLQGSRGGLNDLADQFNAQARQWFAQMHQLAGQFAQTPADAGQIADAWRKALGAAGQNPFPELFRSLRGPALEGLERWMLDAQPMLDAWKHETQALLSLPAFGPAREHQERWQRLLKAQLDCQQHAAAFNALLARSGEEAFVLFEQKLAEHQQPGRQLTSARALFDLWIDACEEAYAKVALSAEFRSAYTRVVDAQMTLRLAVQGQVEQLCESIGLPTRSEVDAAHRKVAQLERQVRRLQQALAPATSGVQAAQAPSPRAAASGKPTGMASKKTVPATGKPARKLGAMPAATVAAKTTSRSTYKPTTKVASEAASKANPTTVSKTVPRSPPAGKSDSARNPSRTASAASPARSAIPANAMPMAPQPLTRGSGKNWKR